MPNHKLKRQKKMGETPIILLPVVAPEPHMKSRTPSDSAIVAIFQDKRKPAEGLKHAFPLDFTAVFGPDGGEKHIAQGVQHACGVRSPVDLAPNFAFWFCDLSLRPAPRIFFARRRRT